MAYKVFGLNELGQLSYEGEFHAFEAALSFVHFHFYHWSAIGPKPPSEWRIVRVSDEVILAQNWDEIETVDSGSEKLTCQS